VIVVVAVAVAVVVVVVVVVVVMVVVMVVVVGIDGEPAEIIISFICRSSFLSTTAAVLLTLSTGTRGARRP